MRWKARVQRFEAQSPSDLSAVDQAAATGLLDAKRVIGVLGKTEGNGCVNDFTRGYATESVIQCLERHGAAHDAPAEERAVVVMSGGTEGCLSPHWIVFEKLPDDAPEQTEPRLAMAQAVTRALMPEEIGTSVQIQLVADAVRAAMEMASIDSADDVHYVQVKCPLLTRQRIAEANARGASTSTTDTYKSMSYSRAASALGVGVALDELDGKTPGELGPGICQDFDLYSSRASTSAGVELMHHEILVLGNSRAWGGDLVIGHRVMKDAIDLDAVQGVLGDLGFESSKQLSADDRDRLIAMLAKAEPSQTGTIRGARHTMLDDSDIPATRHARALVGGVLAAMVGDTRLFVSGGAEHQGPDGGGPVAAIARLKRP
ncbi:TPA: ring-opening amidohydrolase [Pseudomonas aeruginosa]|jgi:cyanuric acid amidohydrolase|uniref:Cyanuric acid amidohydrolase n=1 Tax=Pseudomonas putida TaxID=303 RepID=A0ABD7BMW1_PSEPU|nr:MULTISPECIES: ring-opening amidohydrolase [Pseudomonas]MDP9058170.1 ring-opening amidohydrolase [Pseudomonadota bacterium]MBG4297281.1 ring-opening amidohydrolase [Pseudomonas aeruginosa]MBG5445725.1 ring-opening amidohydrolase [Pseudomonas aeruginosa]MBG7392683.1 ring-opening amidohydrolase [Pseudomonas aeruginosa]MBH3375702.1 ring-opening amidohydrolase [Pseudomonas juntendi]